ncbi:hypothetical protein C365_06445 [Cryptococcus neoformans Bt85]|nr:hypothetical protein C365_06445 [Cryptococcus neoformans var. grubii Bt85]
MPFLDAFLNAHHFLNALEHSVTHLCPHCTRAEYGAYDWGIVGVGDQFCGSRNNCSLSKIHHRCTDQLVNDNKGVEFEDQEVEEAGVLIERDHPDHSSEIQAHPLVGEKGAQGKQHGKGRQFRDRGDSGGYHEDGCDEE